MEKENYDLAFGFGATCGCSQTLRRAGLQYLSVPGDWTGIVWSDATHPRLEHDLRLRADVFCQGPGEMFSSADLHFRGAHPENGKDVYYNERLRYVFNHDFPGGGDLTVELPKVVAKYERRYRRLTDLIRRSGRVLVVRMDIPSDDRPKTSLDDCRYARQKLREMFPSTTFDFVLLSFEKGRSYENLVDETTEDGIRHFAFDYAATAPGADPYQPDLAKSSRLFVERFSVSDYRTPEEIAAHRLANRRKKWAKVGATGPIGYFLRKNLPFLQKRKYDLAIPLGNACSCTQTLRRAKLQLLSFPYDWVTTGSRDTDILADLSNRVDDICGEFDGWLDINEFESFTSGEFTSKADFYRNRRLNLLFLHDFPKGVPLESSFSEINAKYQRRIKRLLELLRKSKRVLILRVDRPNMSIPTPLESCRDAIRRLSAKFPGTTFDLILLQQKADVPFEERHVEDLGSDLTRIRFDYQDRRPGMLASAVRIRETAAAVRALASVRDYRTVSERIRNLTARLRKHLNELIAIRDPKGHGA